MQKRFFMNVKVEGLGPTPVYESNGGLDVDTGTAAIAVSYPATVNANDILICQLLDADDDTFSTPSGWNKITGSELTHADLSIVGFWRRATGSESGTETFTSASAAGLMIAGIMSRYSGCLTSGTPYEGFQSAGITNSDTADVPAVTTTDINRLVVNFLQIEDNTAYATATDYTEAFRIPSTIGSDCEVKVQYQQVATAQTTTARTSAASRAEFWGSFSIALIPAAA